MNKLEFDQKHLSMYERLAAAVNRAEAFIGQAQADGSSHTLNEIQVETYARFVRMLKHAVRKCKSGAFKRKCLMGRVILPPRTGKGVIAGHCIAASGMKATVIVPRKVLVEQMVKDLREQLPGIPVGCYYSEKKQLEMWGVNVTTYSTLSKEMRAKGCLPIEIATSSLVFCDEGHRAMTNIVQRVLRKGFDPLTIRVALTATPNYNDERRLKWFFPLLVKEITIAEAVELDLLAPLRVWVLDVRVSAANVPVNAGDFAPDQLARVMEELPMLGTALHCRYLKGNQKKAALICCVDQAQARLVKEYFEKHRPADRPAPALLLGETSKKERNRIRQEFENGTIDTIINVGVLIEGWTSRRCKLLIDMAPSISYVRATQKYFRPLTKDGRTEARMYILLPQSLERQPLLPFDLLLKEREPVEQGKLIASRVSKKENNWQPPQEVSPVASEHVTLRNRIRLMQQLVLPRLNIRSKSEIGLVLASNAQIQSGEGVILREFKKLIFRHPLFTGTGDHLLRYMGFSLKPESYLTFLQEFAPEVAASLYLRLNRDKDRTKKERFWREDMEWQIANYLEDGRDLERDPEECLVAYLDRPVLGKALISLPTREEKVIRQRFGLIPGRYDHDLSLEEIGDLRSVTRERVRQIEAKGLRMLRHPKRSARLKILALP